MRSRVLVGLVWLSACSDSPTVEDGGAEGGGGSTQRCTSPPTAGPYQPRVRTELGGRGEVVAIQVGPDGDAFVLARGTDRQATVTRLTAGGGATWSFQFEGDGRGVVPFSIALGEEALYLAAFVVTRAEQSETGELVEGDLAVVELTVEGGLGWERRFEGGQEWLDSDIASDEGEIVVAYPRRRRSAEAIDEDPAGLLRLGPGGERLAQAEFPDVPSATRVGLALAGDGAAFVAYGDTLALVDASGTIQWDQRVDHLRTIAGGGETIIAASETPQPFTDNLLGWQLREIDAEGTEIWSERFAWTTESGRVHGVARSCDGSIAVVGEQRELGSDPGDFTSRMFVAHHDSGGGMLWSVDLGSGNQYGLASAAAWDPDGELVVGVSVPVASYETTGVHEIQRLSGT